MWRLTRMRRHVRLYGSNWLWGFVGTITAHYLPRVSGTRPHCRVLLGGILFHSPPVHPASQPATASQSSRAQPAGIFVNSQWNSVWGGKKKQRGIGKGCRTAVLFFFLFSLSLFLFLSFFSFSHTHIHTYTRNMLCIVLPEYLSVFEADGWVHRGNE